MQFTYEPPKRPPAGRSNALQPASVMTVSKPGLLLVRPETEPDPKLALLHTNEYRHSPVFLAQVVVERESWNAAQQTNEPARTTSGENAILA